MTQTCTERDGLTHAVFLRRLAGAPSATSADARLGNGAFLALRLVDLLGPGRGPAHADVFRYQHAATERVCRELPADRTETAHLAGLVRSAADAFRTSDVGLVVPALLAYAHYLENELLLEEALDVLEALIHVGGPTLNSPDAIGVRLRLARVFRKLNSVEEADARYSEAGRLASSAGDLRSALLSEIGRALVVQARGDLRGAEEALRGILADARAKFYEEAEAGAWHALGTTLFLRGDVAGAITCVWRAFESYDDEPSQLRALNEIGMLFLSLGEADVAELALSEVVRRGARPDMVTNALIELMHCSTYRGDRIGFERWRGQCLSLLNRMPPNMIADFHLKAGIGYARFGNFRVADELLTEALTVAAAHDLHELEFRVERIKGGLHECQSLLSAAPVTFKEPTQDLSLREVRLSLKEFATIHG